MEKVKISGLQLFILIFLFELGTAIVVGLGFQAKKDAWLAVLIGMFAGLFIFLIYYALFRLYPDLPLTSYLKEILGKHLGVFVGILYLFYFLYDATRDVRDFGELLTTSTYIYTPIFVINFMMLFTVGYILYHGIETLARTGEILLIVLTFFGVIAAILIAVSGQWELNQLLPILENGWKPVLSTAFPLTLTFPFGEMIAFTIILPCLNRPKNALKIGLWGMIASGLILAETMATNIAILGLNVASRSSFPLLAAMSLINLPNILQRLDIIAVLALIIGGFLKIAVLYYAAVICAAEVFNVSDYRKLVFPLGVVILFSSITVAGNFAEHIEEGLKIVPYYIHIYMQIAIPLLLLAVAFIRRKKWKRH
ncbi:MAG TPA: GerAB/ArcD/ProY family transporter [Bacillales bacterium]